MANLQDGDPNWLNNVYVTATNEADKDTVFGGPYAGAPNMPARVRDCFAVDRRDDEMATRALIRQTHGIAPTPLKVLCLGDSITAGGNSTDGTGYRGWLVSLLDRRGIAATVTSDGINGATLTTLTPTVAGFLTPPPDVVLLAVGTNDAATGDTLNWFARYGALVDQILAISTTVKVVCARVTITDPTWVGYTATIATTEATLNTYVDAVVAARPGRVVSADLSTIPSQWLTNGGLLPGEAGYLRMAQVFVKAMGGWL